MVLLESFRGRDSGVHSPPCGTSDDVLLALHSMMLLQRLLLWLVGEVDEGRGWLF